MNLVDYYIGLDPAATMGIAIVPGDQDWGVVLDCKGDPIQQLTFFLPLLLNEMLTDTIRFTFVLERLHVNRNITTNRSLSERSGYIKYSLKAFGFPVLEVPPKVARKSLGTKSKGETHSLFLPCFVGKVLTDDHTDALAAALWAKRGDDGQELKKGFVVYDWGSYKARQESKTGTQHQGHPADARA